MPGVSVICKFCMCHHHHRSHNLFIGQGDNLQEKQKKTNKKRKVIVLLYVCAYKQGYIQLYSTEATSATEEIASMRNTYIDMVPNSRGYQTKKNFIKKSNCTFSLKP